MSEAQVGVISQQGENAVNMSTMDKQGVPERENAMTNISNSPVSAGLEPAPGFDSVCVNAQALSRADKYRLVQMLVSDLAQDDCLALVQPGGQYSIWSQYDAYEAADVLYRMLEEEKAGS
jgi:hypothetical protein